MPRRTRSAWRSRHGGRSRRALVGIACPLGHLLLIQLGLHRAWVGRSNSSWHEAFAGSSIPWRQSRARWKALLGGSGAWRGHPFRREARPSHGGLSGGRSWWHACGSGPRGHGHRPRARPRHRWALRGPALRRLPRNRLPKHGLPRRTRGRGVGLRGRTRLGRARKRVRHRRNRMRGRGLVVPGQPVPPVGPPGLRRSGHGGQRGRKADSESGLAHHWFPTRLAVTRMMRCSFLCRASVPPPRACICGVPTPFCVF